ncbi:MAG: RagB/SusD family nutrient uptake outer membrane protein [Prevotella sp.]|nr:RagB/SusD family nutrient uptake outer membrane protein [Prevotella sp.]
MKTKFKYMFSAAALLLTVGLTSCTGDLDVNPIDPNLQTKENTPAYKLFNKCYANIALAGNSGPDGDCDIDGLDGGTTGYVRQLFNSQELTTDEAICAWATDEGISNFNYNTYDASHPMLKGFYNRLYTGITFCNQYMADYGDADATMTAEVRFIRALNYYYLLDGWGNVPFATEISSSNPQQIKRADLYDWLINELITEIEPKLNDPQPKTSATKGYGRVDKAAAWMLLARLYLNAEVYKGTADWANAKLYAKKVIDSPYKLYTTKKGQWSAYQQLFLGDNGENGSSVEAVFPILQDGTTTASYGTTLFLMAGSTDASVHIKDANTAGVNADNPWGGNRMRSDLVAKFFPNNDAPNVAAYDMPAVAGDDRAIFDGEGRVVENGDDVAGVAVFTNGFAVGKFSNFKSDGSAGHNSKFPDADFFLMRAAEAYLMYAEADARQNGGSTTAEGTQYINALRTRANATTRTAYSLSDICDEWSREFYFEGMRRTTLIRFGRFGGNVNYNWSWKGGVKNGRNFDSHYNLFAIPTSDLTANSNLKQNAGYK